MSPQDGLGGWVPSPRYESPASARIATGKLMVACTISGGSVLGRMWRPIRARSPAPRARAATTKSRSRNSRKLARVSRAKTGRKAMPIATIEIVRVGLKTAVSSRADRIAGKPWIASTSRMKASSSQPPK